MMHQRRKTEAFFQQLYEKETSTYTYLIADPETGDGIIIDPVIETKDRDLKWIKDLGINLKYILETHVHADHITGAWSLKEETGAKIVLSEFSEVKRADLKLKNNEELKFGKFKVKGIATPGHTNGCITYEIDGMLFTGDTLFIRGCGRTDFQEGDSETLFNNVREKLFSYPDDTMVYPAHDYKGVLHSTIGEEKKYNPRLKLDNSLEDFIKIMDGLNLAYPKKIDVAVPANIECGKI
jgi:sulfur dioxygenase